MTTAVAARTTCQDCDAPIAQPAGSGRRKVFCAACAALRRTQAKRKWWASRTDEQRTETGQYRREYTLQRNSSTRVAEFDALLAAQSGRCAICGTDKPNGHGWHVDHNHKSGAVRGILCSGCNVGIGQLRDDPAILRAATAYLERT